MKPLAEYDHPELWESVSGIDCDGPSSRQHLEELFTGQLSRDEAWECLANLCRDYDASTAGIAAIPLLLLREAPDTYLAHLSACWAGEILTTLPPETDIPEALRPHVADEFRSLAEKRMRETAGAAQFTATDLLAYCETVLALKGEKHLAERVSAVLEEELHRRTEEANRSAKLYVLQTTYKISGGMISPE